jgi:hypothetical protein
MKKKVEEKETESREGGTGWRVTSDWLKLHCRGGGYLGDAWGVNEQGFRWASEGLNFIV